MKYKVREGKEGILADLLSYRGIEGKEAVEAFISPDYETHTHDPFLMRDMDRAVERLYKAVKDGEKIVVFSDYDADGIPGAVILHDMIKKIGYMNFINYIPHRHDEGFGLNIAAVDEFKAAGATLLITIDCGISDLEEVAHAQSLGIDVIVTDHHLPHAELPPAYAILDPKIDECAYPEKMLCGSGVIFKFVQAFLKKYGAEFGVIAGWEKWLLDMVGIATLSDMVPLVGENRTFAVYGLKVLKKTPRPGLSRLFTNLRVKREHITEDDIGFTISPRINAASRMGEPEHAFLLLSTSDESVAGVYAEKLEHVNNERKGTVASLVKEIKKILVERSVADKNVIVMGNPSWRPSLLGLVANSLSEEYGKPVFLWGRDGDGLIKGSCRSQRGQSVVSIMTGAKDIFSEFGGHAASGGFAVLQDHIHVLEEKLSQACSELESSGTSNEKILNIDAQISLEEVGWNLYKDLEKLSPFGVGNPKPIFLIKGASIVSIKSFGKTGNHTEIILEDSNGRKMSAIQFFAPTESLPSHVTAGSSADFIVHLEKSTFKSYPELRLRIVEVAA